MAPAEIEDPTSLPNVVLLNFNAISDGKRVNLFWQTASENNNDYFTFEKSKDGIAFDPAFFANGAGKSNSLTDYTEIDFSPLKGISYYRLMQTSLSGESTYSSVIPVNYVFGDDGISIYPNPANEGESVQINFTGLANQEVLVVVQDTNGNEHYSKVILVPEENHLTAIPTDARLIPGTYLVIASSINKIYSQKLIVK
ncbi:MAG: T9SS type A sorting domain-containing protein [Bacteroidota bacterium]|nr:T9SS type A sorting domain-containing protein [Bacteroidota bacterium]